MLRLVGLASAVIVSLAAWPAEAASDQRHVLVDHWKVSCRPGDDEFASNCRATSKAKGLVFEFATGDSQLFLTVSAPGCATLGAGDANWWRDKLTALEAPARRRLLVGAMQGAADQIAARCPALRPARLIVRSLPDIAARGRP